MIEWRRAMRESGAALSLIRIDTIISKSTMTNTAIPPAMNVFFSWQRHLQHGAAARRLRRTFRRRGIRAASSNTDATARRSSQSACAARLSGSQFRTRRIRSRSSRSASGLRRCVRPASARNSRMRQFSPRRPTARFMKQSAPGEIASMQRRRSSLSLPSGIKRPRRDRRDQLWGCRAPSRIRRHSLNCCSTDSSAMRSRAATCGADAKACCSRAPFTS